MIRNIYLGQFTFGVRQGLGQTEFLPILNLRKLQGTKLSTNKRCVTRILEHSQLDKSLGRVCSRCKLWSILCARFQDLLTVYKTLWKHKTSRAADHHQNWENHQNKENLTVSELYCLILGSKSLPRREILHFTLSRQFGLWALLSQRIALQHQCMC